jgi:hypothetical protein
MVGEKEWDVFISHASEDKKDFVRPLALALAQLGVKVWLLAHTCGQIPRFRRINLLKKSIDLPPQQEYRPSRARANRCYVIAALVADIATIGHISI